MYDQTRREISNITKDLLLEAYSIIGRIWAEIHPISEDS